MRYGLFFGVDMVGIVIKLQTTEGKTLVQQGSSWLENGQPDMFATFSKAISRIVEVGTPRHCEVSSVFFQIENSEAAADADKWAYVPDKDAKHSKRLAELVEKAKTATGTAEVSQGDAVTVRIDECEHEKFASAMIRGHPIRFQTKDDQRDKLIASHLERLERMAEERHMLHGSVRESFWECSRLPCRAASAYLRNQPKERVS